MAYQEHRFWYREQMEITDNKGNVTRNVIQACYIIGMVDDAGLLPIIITNKSGIINIPLIEFPELKSTIENMVPLFVSAAEQKYREKINNELAAIEAAKNNPDSTPVQ